MSQAERQKFLHLDDEPLQTNASRRIFSRLGFGLEHHSLNDPREVLKIVRALRPRILLLDRQMPYRSGLQVLDLLDKNHLLVKREELLRERRIERGRLVAVMFSGGASNDVAVLQAVQSGKLLGSIEKPTDARRIVEALRPLVDDPIEARDLTILRSLTMEGFDDGIFHSAKALRERFEKAWPAVPE